MVYGAARRGLASVALVEAAPLALAGSLLVLGRLLRPHVPRRTVVALVLERHADRQPRVVVIRWYAVKLCFEVIDHGVSPNSNRA